MERVGSGLPHPVAHLVEELRVAVLAREADPVATAPGQLFADLDNVLPRAGHAQPLFVEDVFAVEEHDRPSVAGQAIEVAVIGAQLDGRLADGLHSFTGDLVFQWYEPACRTERRRHELV